MTLQQVQMSAEAINNNLNILIDPTFTNVNKLFVLAYQVDANNNDNRQSFSQFYLPRVMVNDFNYLILSILIKYLLRC